MSVQLETSEKAVIVTASSVLTGLVTNAGVFKGSFFGVVHYLVGENVNQIMDGVFKEHADGTTEKMMQEAMKFFFTLSSSLVACNFVGLSISFYSAMAIGGTSKLILDYALPLLMEEESRPAAEVENRDPNDLGFQPDEHAIEEED